MKLGWIAGSIKRVAVKTASLRPVKFTYGRVRCSEIFSFGDGHGSRGGFVALTAQWLPEALLLLAKPCPSKRVIRPAVASN